jgi:hypothetical protein
MVLTYCLPNEPVPPVIKIDLSLNNRPTTFFTGFENFNNLSDYSYNN